MIHYLPKRYHTPKWQAKIIPSDKQFLFSDGTIVSSLWELKTALNLVGDDVLSTHIGPDHHHLADWVEFVIQDPDLAQAFRQNTHRWGLLVALERHLMRTLNLPGYVARRWLSPAANPLNFMSGQIIHSLDELHSSLEQVPDEVVDFHLERVPNDISQWVLYNIGDYDLAEMLAEASNRGQMVRILTDHLEMLKEASQES